MVAGRKKIRDSSKQVKIRIDESMDTDLRILYGLDKISSGGMSFNQWLVFQFHKLILSNSDRLKVVKMKYESKLFVDREERNIE
jgi:hypothetical protein